MPKKQRGYNKSDIEAASETIIHSSAFTSNVPMKLNVTDASSSQKQQEISERVKH